MRYGPTEIRNAERSPLRSGQIGIGFENCAHLLEVSLANCVVEGAVFQYHLAASVSWTISNRRWLRLMRVAMVMLLPFSADTRAGAENTIRKTPAARPACHRLRQANDILPSGAIRRSPFAAVL